MRYIAGLLLIIGFAHCAAAVDCDLVYDEFDNVMNKQFLLNPDNYVSTQSHRLSRQDYNSRQKDKFLLSQAHQGLGVAVVHTNNNTWGKLLFTWGRPIQQGQPSLIIKKAVLYGRVADGFRPRVRRDIRIRSSFTYDLDGGTEGGAGADIWFHNVDGREMYIEAVNGASLKFPMESLCADRAQAITARVVRPQYELVTVGELQTGQTVSPPTNPGSSEKYVVKREVLPNGHVLITYSDGSKIEHYQGGWTKIAPDGSQTTAMFSTGAPVAFPVAPPDDSEQQWLNYHRQYLLGIIESMVADPSLVQQAVDALEEPGNIYASIATRSQIIQRLVSD